MQSPSSSHPLTWVLEWIGVIKRKGRRRCFRQMILCEQRHGSVPWGFVVRICTYWSIRLCERLVHVESVQVGTGCIIIVSTIRNLDFVLLARESQWASLSFEEGDSADRVSSRGNARRQMRGCCRMKSDVSGNSSYSGGKGCLLWGKNLHQNPINTLVIQ